ncbi:MAG: LacI family transcriptional regulator [Rariglobus sp.]|jgi:LacI family transcriptional regulator|nr:LacI family transcriptional regulator [Rariglobus sp.]
MPRRITIRDIATRAGVHFSTVSLALRNSPKLRPEVCRRVRAIADELGYVPDPAMAALTAYRNSTRPVHYQATLAWVNNWPVRTDLRRIKTFDMYFQGAEERARQLGYRIDELWLHAPAMTATAAHAILRARNITGLLLAPQPFAHTPLSLDLKEFSALAFGYSLQPSNLHVVTNHQYQSASLMMRRLTELGYRRIGLFLRSDWDEKVNGSYLSALLFMQHHLPPAARVPPLLTKDGLEHEFVTWFKRHKPDVVVAVDRAVRGWIESSLGLRIPGDVGLANLNVNPDDTWQAGIHQNDRLIGATAVDFLAGMLQRNERGIPATPIRTLVEGVWKSGTSVRDTTSAPHAPAARRSKPRAS